MAEFLDVHAPYRPLIDTGNHTQAIETALTMLEAIQLGSPAAYDAEHKGTPFYIMGYAAFACHDYLSASLYFDAAVDSDMKYHVNKLDTAAMRFIQLLQTQSEPLLAQHIIDEIINTFSVLISDYNSRPLAHNITMDDIRDKFIVKIIQNSQPEQRILITALISFVAEWPYRQRQMKLCSFGSREPFFMHLFRGCVLFESLLKVANGTPSSVTTLGKAITHHASNLGIATTNIDIRESDFDQILSSISVNMNIEQSIQACGRTRNTIGHNLTWSATHLNSTTYDLLIKNIASACLHAISRLYI